MILTDQIHPHGCMAILDCGKYIKFTVSRRGKDNFGALNSNLCITLIHQSLHKLSDLDGTLFAV
jgi:hypothetical protein